MRTSTSFALLGSALNLRGRLAWAHDFSAGQSIPAAFQSLPGQGVIVGVRLWRRTRRSRTLQSSCATSTAGPPRRTSTAKCRASCDPIPAKPC
ncbi:hypothetical protein EAS62_29155 [Bradyrhizobium zhanjiangense]|uniref:Uncharacterized protein n=1 Tax=Bradyrhizobium zhanjiangense TaxID=1325107 RepID=A0ABY0DDL7_9BRAD|nr:hypothetical protein EAS62_29155 [Bradyrhizobium zhanjiangense]